MTSRISEFMFDARWQRTMKGPEVGTKIFSPLLERPVIASALVVQAVRRPRAKMGKSTRRVTVLLVMPLEGRGPSTLPILCSGPREGGMSTLGPSELTWRVPEPDPAPPTKQDGWYIQTVYMVSGICLGREGFVTVYPMRNLLVGLGGSIQGPSPRGGSPSWHRESASNAP